ncbi:hypothetical protein AWH48_15735 [Domibacillus aminovorans]|uniref:IDEAL domain-containing protein n=2 Tax=Bacillales TaxID=1385 RepID=A0A177L181_9BACI|nr:hypothetical protein AWH48_15735 [Domibacillus aminovorans]
MMNIGDWVLAASGQSRYISYIDHFLKDTTTAYVIKVARVIDGEPEWMEPTLAIVSLRSISVMNNTLAKEDYQAMIDLAIMTADKEWFFELRERMMRDA